MPPPWIERYCGTSAAQCARSSAAQALQLLLFATCARRVWLLSAQSPRHASSRTQTAASVLFSLHVLLAGIALALSAAVAALLVLAPPAHFPPVLCASDYAWLRDVQLVTSSLGAVSWGFYASLLCLERARVRGEQSELALLLAVFLAIYGVLGLLDSPSPTASTQVVARITTATAVVVAAVAAVGVLRQWMHWRVHAVGASRGSLNDKLLAGPRAASPFDRAGLLSRLAYWWLSPLIALGARRRLEASDVPALPAQDATDTAARAFERALERELRSPAPSFLRAARRLYGAEVAFFAAWSTANKLVGLASPVLIKLFLDWAAEPAPVLATGYWLATAMAARSVLAAVSGTQYALAWKRFDLRVRAGVVSAIYGRALALSSAARRRYGLGRITNLVSVDLGRLVGMPGAVFDMVLVPGEIAVALLLLSREVSYAFVAGVAVLGVMLPLQTALGGKIQAVTAQMLAFRDARVGVAAESLRAIKTLKLLAWVDVQLRAMNAHREREMGRLAVRKYLDALCVFFWASTPVIVQTAVFAAVVYSGHDVTAANAFTAVSLLDRLIFPMNYFPWIINGFLEARVSALRIREFLFESAAFDAPLLAPPRRADTATTATAATPRNAVEISDCIFTWGQDDTDGDSDSANDSATTPLMPTAVAAPRSAAFELSIEQLSLQQGRDYVVCGPVGAGKSSLLLALLGEMRRQSGHLRVLRRRAAYAPQTPWLFRASVRQNITMCDEDAGGAERVDEALYRRVLQACELELDLRAKPQFDRTPVGENGSNLSGGQRLRVNLARALYQRTGLYLLDDPFSGLDATTAARIVANCFGPGRRLFPDDAAVVLVTHSLHLLELLPRDVEVIVMQEGGVLESGRYDALVAPGSASRLQLMLTDASRQRQHAHSSGNSSADSVVSEHSANTSDPNDEEGGAESHDDSDEHREAGVVNLRVWKAYASAMGWPLSLAILLSLVAMQVSRNGLDWWIGVYTNGHRVAPRVFADTLLWITLANCAAVFLRSFLFAFGGLRAARSVYARLVASVFHAALSFFDATPVGRVLNRLSGDTYAVDESLPFILNIFLKDAADVVGSLVILFYGNRLVLLLLVPLSALYFQLQRRYRPAARHVRRLDAVAQSPILTMFTETLAGLHVIRAMQLERAYAAAYGRCLDRSQRMSFLGANTGAWFGIRLDMLGVCVTSFVAVAAVAEFHATGAVNPGILGLTLTYALPIVSKLNAALGSFVDTEQQMIAVERVREYAALPDEEAVVSSGRRSLPRTRPNDDDAAILRSGWPRQGAIQFDGLTVTYAAPGSTRSVTALSDLARGLEAPVEVGDATLSKGQSQLLGAARALLRPSKVLCVDEATASVDLETEQLVAKTLETEFAGSTVVVVAHRVQTIMSCDRVLVFDRGRLAESGAPRTLASDSSSMFHALVSSGGLAELQ
ncbi:hypothetical protein PybrP1_005790 [[Pythium] brassicae (nom. inval.)]|nr:hypothetical protein PybrP1_005790 [[Pythium] brassicae (nom. inval.)]